MIYENKKLLNAEIVKKESKVKIKEFLEGVYELFYLILKNPLDNFWWECFSILIQYIQLMIFSLDEKVSIFLF
jgi:hypothetical protein